MTTPSSIRIVGQYGEGSIIESRFSPYTAPVGAIADAQTKFKTSYNAKYGTYPGHDGRIHV